MTVRIALVNPRMEGPYPPLGLGYIASYLRRYGSFNYDLRIIDGNTRADVRNEIEEMRPHIVGFTGHSPQIKEAVDLSNSIRRWSKDAFQMIGGVHVSADPSGTLKRGSFDIAVLGEGEETFLEAVDTFVGSGAGAVRSIRGVAYLDGDRVRVNEKRPQIEDLDSIPFPARDLFDMKYYMGLSFGVRGLVRTGVTSITSSRGCPYNCTFCGVNIVFKKVRQFSRDYCLEEIKELIGKHRAKALYFADDTFVTNKKGVAEFCEKLASSRLSKKVIWTAQARANLIGWSDLEMLKQMKKAGCVQLEYGFESGSDHVLGLLKQSMVKVEDNQRAIDVTKASGLRVLGTFIVGTPGEGAEDLRMTKEFIARNMKKIDYFQTFICTPFPGSAIYRTCVERGIVKPDYFEELGRREKEGGVQVYTDTLEKDVVVEALKDLDYLGLKKVSLLDKARWVLYHLVRGSKDVSHRDRFYIWKRLAFYFASFLTPRAGRKA